MRKFWIVPTAAAVVSLLAAGYANGGGRTVGADNFDFQPKTVTIQKGDRVTWHNLEGRHTVTLKNGTFDKVISGDERVSRRFNHRGTFRYICRFHTAQGMRGKVIVD